MAQFDRHFTLQEARAELPRLRSDLLLLQESLTRLEAARAEAEPAIQQAESNGGSAAAGRYFKQQAVTAEVFEQITSRGIQIKDPWRGLVDFPHILDGREVLLCWLLGEADIGYWHDLETGFGGRRPIRNLG